MILNRSYYLPPRWIKSFWTKRFLRRYLGDKKFKFFGLHKTIWPDRIYFYSPRLKRIPRFTGNKELLRNWKESKNCETMCPTQAIKVTADAFIIDDRGCIACGLCVELAPKGLLEVSTQSNLHQSN